MTIMTLWLPIIVSAVVTFIAGAVIWMAMPWHKGEWQQTPDEEAVRAALKDCPPGMYTVPGRSSTARKCRRNSWMARKVTLRSCRRACPRWEASS